MKSEESRQTSQRQSNFKMAAWTGQIMGGLMISLMITLSNPLPSHASDISRLGYRWDVTVPGGWTGIWTRRDILGAISNQYDAVWSHPTYGTIRSDIRIHLDVRDGLIIERRDLTGEQTGKTCRYTGRLYYSQGTANGTFGCQWAPGPFSWSARTWR